MWNSTRLSRTASGTGLNSSSELCLKLVSKRTLKGNTVRQPHQNMSDLLLLVWSEEFYTFLGVPFENIREQSDLKNQPPDFLGQVYLNVSFHCS